MSDQQELSDRFLRKHSFRGLGEYRLGIHGANSYEFDVREAKASRYRELPVGEN